MCNQPIVPVLSIPANLSPEQVNQLVPCYYPLTNEEMRSLISSLRNVGELKVSPKTK